MNKNKTTWKPKLSVANANRAERDESPTIDRNEFIDKRLK